MIRPGLTIAALFAVTLITVGCATTPSPTEGSAAGVAGPSPIIEESLKNLGIASPRSLVRAEASLGESTAGYSTEGLELSYVAYKMIQVLYPIYLKPEYQIFPPAASIYPELFQKVQAGKFPSVSQADVSFLTLIIPPMAVLFSDSPDVVEASREALDNAEKLNPNSVLPPYLKGFIDERKGDNSGALVNYEKALNVDSSCYPAAIGKARILIDLGEYNQADLTLENLMNMIPTDGEVYRLLAEVQFRLGSYTAARGAVDKSLAADPGSRSGLVLSAKIYEAQKEYTKALDALTKAKELGSPTPQTILLEAQLQKENGNLSAAVSTLAGGVKTFPSNSELSDAYGKALIETGKAAEGGQYLAPSDGQSSTGADSLELLVTDAIDTGSWKAAATYVDRLLALRSNEHTLRQAYTIYSSLGNRAKTLEFAEKLRAAAPSNPKYLVEEISALIDAGRRERARTMIDQNLSNNGLPDTMSSLYYLRSRIQSDPSAQLSDLRSALLENLENLPALISIARYYLHAGEIGSARRFAEQAAAFLPTGQKLPPDLEKILPGSANDGEKK